MVDCNDLERIDTLTDDNGSAKEAMHWMLGDEQLRGIPLLVFANKQDLPNAISADELTDRLGMNGITNREWKVIGSCATTGEGLREGLDWILGVVNLFVNNYDEASDDEERQ